MPFQPRLRIGDEWIANTGATLPVRNPFTGETIAEVPLGGRPQIEAALSAAEIAFPVARCRPRHERAQLLLKIASLLERDAEEFAGLIVAEAGKPITFAEAEVARAVITFQAAAEEARRAPGELLPLDAFAPGEAHHGFTERFPLGILAAITPFNFPLNLVAHKIAPCLATGNCAVVKPALKTPLTALRLAEILAEAGVPPGEVNFVLCPNEDVAHLVTDPRVRIVSFTGSDAVGWPLKARCPDKRVTLELGGNAALIVHEDADWLGAIPAIATGAFAAAGQSCISVQRLLVHAPIYQEFREALCTHLREKIHTGDPRARQTVVGPLITPEALAKTEARLAEALRDGAHLLHGGQTFGPCLEATLLEHVPHTAELWSEEAFAPVLLLERYQHFEAALALVNASRYGLQAGLFTRDYHRAWQAFQQLEVGAVLINEVPTWRVENMPYGGVKASGFGREGLRYAMEEMTEPRALIFRL